MMMSLSFDLETKIAPWKSQHDAPLLPFEMSGQVTWVSKDIELDAVSLLFEPYVTILQDKCRLHIHTGNALVLLPGMLFQNSSGY